MSPAQSDFTVRRPPTVPEADAPADGVPRAELRSSEPSAASVRWVYILMFVVLAALLVITVVGPHIPAGE